MTDHLKREMKEALIRDAKTGGMSRRDFLTYSIAAGMSVSAASGLWTSDVSAATPEKGGKFRIGVHDANTSDTHDPGAYLSVGQIQLAHTHRSYLTEITPENGLGPDMADSWSASPDAKVWTFKLNENATFHDGRKFTAKDAIASLNHHRGEESTSSAKPLMDAVTDIKADGDHTIVIELSQGFADLPWVMTDYHLAMLPANDDGTIDWESGIGAGPYKIIGHEPGIGTELERHDGWHREGAHFDAIEFDGKTKALLARNANIVVDDVPSGSAITLPMFSDQAPFDNVDVRLALKYAIDRDELVEKIMFGSATPGDDYHVSPGMPGFIGCESVGGRQCSTGCC